MSCLTWQLVQSDARNSSNVLPSAKLLPPRMLCTWPLRKDIASQSRARNEASRASFNLRNFVRRND